MIEVYVGLDVSDSLDDRPRNNRIKHLDVASQIGRDS